MDRLSLRKFYKLLEPAALTEQFAPILARPDWDNCEQLDIAQLYPHCRDLIEQAFLVPIQNLWPRSRGLENALSDEHRATLQFEALGLMMAVFIKGMPQELVLKIFPKLIGMFIYYLYEKQSDDLSVLNDSNDCYANEDFVRHFNECAQALLQNNPPDFRDVVRHCVDHYPNLNFKDTDMHKVFSDVLVNSTQTSRRKLESVEDPNKDASLLNLFSLYLTATHLRQTDSPLSKFGVQALRNRYEATSTLGYDMNMPVNIAIAVGAKSILTDSTFASISAYLGEADPNIGALINQNQETVINAIQAATKIIRLWNDLGLLLAEPEKGIELLINLREQQGLNLAPRALISSLDTPPAILARLYKDSVEGGGEYNIALNAGVTSNLSVQQQWRLLYDNISTCSQAYRQAVKEYISQVAKLPEIPYLTDILSRFVALNVIYYSQAPSKEGADYDVGLKHQTLVFIQNALPLVQLKFSPDSES